MRYSLPPMNIGPCRSPRSILPTVPVTRLDTIFPRMDENILGVFGGDYAILKGGGSAIAQTLPGAPLVPHPPVPSALMGFDIPE